MFDSTNSGTAGGREVIPEENIVDELWKDKKRRRQIRVSNEQYFDIGKRRTDSVQVRRMEASLGDAQG